MQFKSLTTLLLVGVCLSQVTFVHPQETETKQIIIKENIADALSTFNEFKVRVIQIGTDAIDKTTEILAEIIESARNQTIDITIQAQKAGEDITPCLTGIDLRFDDLFNKLVQDEISCVTKEIDEARRIIDESIKIVNVASKSVEDLPQKLKACGSGLSSIICINRVTLEGTKLQADLPGKIAKKVIEVSTFVGGLKFRVETCAGMQVANAGISAAGVVADVAKCAADQIGKPLEN